MGSKKRAAWSKAKSEFLGAATGGDMSDLFAREKSAATPWTPSAMRPGATSHASARTVTTRAPRPRKLWPTAKTVGGAVLPATNANTAVDGT